MSHSPLRIFSCLVACGSLVGCTGEVNNPKMPDIPPTSVKVDSNVPKGRGDGSQPYGASQKYQDMMNK
jgi:hypothetical protein